MKLVSFQRVLVESIWQPGNEVSGSKGELMGMGDYQRCGLRGSPE